MLLSGATYVLISAVLCILIFPKVIAITAFSILIVCDTSSALFGRKYGSRPFFDKSLQGAIAFIISGLAVILVTPKVSALTGEYIVAAVSVLIAAFVESASTRLRLDDNFSVPLSAGGTMWLGYFILAKLIPIPYQTIFEALIN
jgi:dolichol kinase